MKAAAMFPCKAWEAHRHGHSPRAIDQHYLFPALAFPSHAGHGLAQVAQRVCGLRDSKNEEKPECAEPFGDYKWPFEQREIEATVLQREMDLRSLRGVAVQAPGAAAIVKMLANERSQGEPVSVVHNNIWSKHNPSSLVTPSAGEIAIFGSRYLVVAPAEPTERTKSIRRYAEIASHGQRGIG